MTAFLWCLAESMTPIWSARLALIEAQGHFTKVNAELAHFGLIQHHLRAYKVHPIIKLHMVNSAVHW
jgi:hypothetical protein